MIFPWPKISISRQDINFTNIVILLNVILFFTFFFSTDNQKVKSELFNNTGIAITTEFYKNHLEKYQYLDHYKKILETYDFKDKKHQYFLSSFAVRDKFFLEEMEQLKKKKSTNSKEVMLRDEVKSNYWFELISKYKEEVSEQVLFIMGLSHGNKNSLSWITYQFSHMTTWHLISNMIFIFLLGYWIEGCIGSVGFVLLYLCSGIAGGLFYLYFSPNTLLPMVGASGSVSGLIAFYCFYESKLRSRFFYFLSPQKGLNGYIYLPTLLIIPMFLMTDLSSFLGQVPGLSSGVAFTAHLGGAVFGALLGITLRISLKISPKISE